MCLALIVYNSNYFKIIITFLQLNLFFIYIFKAKPFDTMYHIVYLIYQHNTINSQKYRCGCNCLSEIAIMSKIRESRSRLSLIFDTDEPKLLAL